jgi:hypothetical protein
MYDVLLSEILCPQPPVVAHASVDFTREYSFSDEAQYTCNDGYHFKSASRMRCSQDGAWINSGVECERECFSVLFHSLYEELLVVLTGISCNFPGVVQNGNVKFKFGDSVRFECNTGYRLRGAENAEYLATGRWSEELPTCKRKSQEQTLTELISLRLLQKSCVLL